MLNCIMIGEMLTQTKEAIIKLSHTIVSTKAGMHNAHLVLVSLLFVKCR